MKAQYRKLSLVAACVFSLCLMAFFLGWESSQNDLSKEARIHPRTCKCPDDTFRKCTCFSEIRKCSACLHTTGDSDWFDRRFERAVEPLLSEEPMSSDALMSWLGMKSEKEFENQKQQPIKMSPSSSLGRGGSSCLTCAVVGNSRFLRGSGLGSRINQHDVVFRMNQAPVQGFETDVGNMTTIRIMYPDIASTRDPGTQLLLLPLNASGLDWFRKALENQDFIWKPRNPGFQIPQLPSRSGQSKDKVSIISLTFLKYAQERWLSLQSLDGNDYLPSLGFVALLYALHTCDQVSLFGFGTDHFLKWSHYWDDKYQFTSDMHSFESERHIILTLQCEGKVTIYGSWPAQPLEAAGG